jgi:23S rRNA (cytosine1962-C5)-methyltransferase
MVFVDLVDALAPLPLPTNKRIAVHVKPAAERALKGGHPWLFEGAIRKQSHAGEPGDLAVIFDRKDRFLAVGLYDPRSEIRVKVLQHHQPAKIGPEWFRHTLQMAAAIREPLRSSGHTTGYRLVYGENDRLPGLIVDRYADVLVIKLYTTAWLPHLQDVLPALLEVQPARQLVVRLSRNVQAEVTQLSDGMTLHGEPVLGPVQFRENGLKFEADVVNGHKTGFFFDQRDNRQMVRELTTGGDVLDVFAYSGGFSVYAASGGASSVMSVDVSEPALLAAQRNFELNQDNADVARAKHTIMIADAFDTLEKLQSQGRRFGTVIIDPPSFAKRQAEVERALGAYAQLAALGTSLVAPGGWFVMASCSSRVAADVFYSTVQQASTRSLQAHTQTRHALDHPVCFPEGEYLKCAYFMVN